MTEVGDRRGDHRLALREVVDRRRVRAAHAGRASRSRRPSRGPTPRRGGSSRRRRRRPRRGRARSPCRSPGRRRSPAPPVLRASRPFSSVTPSVNCAGRFSANAAMASVRSPVKLDSTCVRFSRSMPACRLPISSWLHMTSFVMRTPNGLLPTISSAVSSADSSDVAVGDDTRDEPDAVGLGRVDQAAGQQQLERARRADQPGQHPRHADVAARQPDADERDVEAGRLRPRCARRSPARARDRRPTRRRSPRR